MHLTPSHIANWQPASLSELKSLAATNRDISHVDDISSCIALARIDLSRNCIKTSQGLSGLHNCTSISWLSVAGNGLEDLAFVEWLAPTIQVLNASNNAIAQLPAADKIRMCKELKALVINHNRLTRIDSIQGLPQLNTLIASHNSIASPLGTDFGTLPALKKLGLAHNALREFPYMSCPTLHELRLNDNKIKRVSETAPALLKILDLGNNRIDSWKDIEVLRSLERLDNINLKGNPLCKTPGYAEKLKEMFPKARILDGARVDPYYMQRKRKREQAAIAVAAAAAAADDDVSVAVAAVEVPSASTDVGGRGGRGSKRTHSSKQK